MAWIMATTSNHLRRGSGGECALVIGGGPAGLVAGLGLSHVCDKVTIVEKHPTFEPLGSAIVIHPNGKKAILEICPELWNDLEAAGLGMPNGGVMLPWWELRDAAVQAVRKRENIELCTGETFTTIEESEHGSSVRVRVTFQSGRDVSADFLVGADGVHSAVRKWLQLPDPVPTGNTYFRGHITITDSCSPEMKSLLDKGAEPFARRYDGTFFTMMTFNDTHAGRMAWNIITTKEVDESTSPLDLLGGEAEPKDFALLQEIFDLSPPKSLIQFPRSSIIDVSDEVLQKYGGGWGGRGRITLVGDAAHAMRAIDGQGGNQALEDAVILYRTFLSHQGDKSIEERLRLFESTRLPRVKQIHHEQQTRYDQFMSGEHLAPYVGENKHWVWDGV